ncbi:nitrite reductase small subunit NirD [Paenarthrobacter sp. DKR-5]|uniref:nitrite reductase small subunit NirD n=1 Tax=Paenarthrobacter sp. DKR-5 TaxID=2835535 RepID=UPI001BDD8263|nr:nitrite reductase small subunit NirD [Paenarthrobacter sp. DKR-5]MBT1002501.1 nitrite reductase small subunit NirD [Paenarthrobacter sp. DKR-5]
MTETLTETTPWGRAAHQPFGVGAPRLWHRVCRTEDLEDSWGEAALVDGVQVALFKLAGPEVYAVDQRDPATAAAVMARGIVGSRGDRPTIASPLHKQVYDLATGECYTDPSLRLPTFAVRLADGWIQVSLGAEAEAAA